MRVRAGSRCDAVGSDNDQRLFLNATERLALAHEVDFLRLLASEFGCDPRKEGPRWKCHSPFRAERTPSCVIYPPGVGRKGDRGWTYCDFGGDNRGGDVVSLLMDAKHLSFPEAAYIAAQYTADPSRWEVDAHTGVTAAAAFVPQVHQRVAVPIAEQRRAIAELIEALLVVDPSAQAAGDAYALSRGATARSIALLGHSYLIRDSATSDAVARHLAADTTRFDRAVRTGLLYDTRQHAHLPPHLYWRDRSVLMPCLARDGTTPTWLVGRRLDWVDGDDWPKYLMAKTEHGSTRAPYGLPSLCLAAQRREPLIICEGPVDAMGAEALGQHAIAMLGRPHASADVEDDSAAVPRQLRWLLPELRSCAEVQVLPDNDPTPAVREEGQRYAAQLVAWLVHRQVPARVIAMSDLGLGQFKDLGDAAQMIGAALAARQQQGMNP